MSVCISGPYCKSPSLFIYIELIVCVPRSGTELVIYYEDMLPIVKTIHGPAQIWSFDCYLGTGTVYASAMPLSARECAEHCDTLTTLDPPMTLKCQMQNQNEQKIISLLIQFRLN